MKTESEHEDRVEARENDIEREKIIFESREKIIRPYNNIHSILLVKYC